MNWKEFFRFNRTKLFMMIAIFVITFVLGLIVGRSFNSSNALLLASYIYFPLQLQSFFDGIFRITIQDFRTCVFPGCNLVITSLTIIVSVSIYYILSSLSYYYRKKYARPLT